MADGRPSVATPRTVDVVVKIEVEKMMEAVVAVLVCFSQEERSVYGTS